MRNGHGELCHPCKPWDEKKENDEKEHEEWDEQLSNIKTDPMDLLVGTLL